MDVDDGLSIPPARAQAAPPPERRHILDALHFELIDHFKTLFWELVWRIDPKLFTAPPLTAGSAASIYSRGYSAKSARLWSCRDFVEYLTSPRNLPHSATREHCADVRRTSSLLANFMTTLDDGQSARTGKEWTRAQWDEALLALRDLARVWKEQPILDSYEYVNPQVVDTFKLPMRPT